MDHLRLGYVLYLRQGLALKRQTSPSLKSSSPDPSLQNLAGQCP